MSRVIGFLTVVILGLTAGAMLTEAVILVPFWLSLSPSEFFDWYFKNQKALVDFYSPLEICSLVLTIASSIFLFITKHERKWSMFASAVLSVLVIATFFMYFKDANAAFNARSIEDSNLRLAITTWGNWQWFRVSLGLAAFISGLYAIVSTNRGR